MVQQQETNRSTQYDQQKINCQKSENTADRSTSEGPFWSTFFWTHKNCLWHYVLAFGSPRITNFLASLPFFFVTLLVPSFLGHYSLLYHESLWNVLFPCCLHLKFTCCTFSGCGLNTFSTSCGFFFMFR